MENNREPSRIEIGEETLKQLDTLGKWTMFLSVSGFIFFGLIISLGLITGTFLTAFNDSDRTPEIPDVLMLAIFIGLALIIFFPIFFLFRFSNHISTAVSTLDRNEIHTAIKYLKHFFINIGVLLIAAISVYIATLILAGTSADFLQLLK
jgi:hypothetical protein